MATFVLLFVRSYEPSYYAYAAVQHGEHGSHEVLVKGHITQGHKPVRGITVKVQEKEDHHWKSVSSVETSKDGAYSMSAPEPSFAHIRVVWVKPHTILPILVHEFKVNPHGKPVAIGLTISPVFKFLFSQGFSY